MGFRTLFCAFTAIPIFLHSQTKNDKLFIGLSAGNDHYMHPATQTYLVSPQFNVFFMGCSGKDSSRIGLCYLAGLGYQGSRQTYTLLWAGSNSRAPTPVTFRTDEFLFSLGGCARYAFFRKVFAAFCLSFQGGQNYTYTHDPNGSVAMARVVYNGNTTIGVFTPPGAQYSTKAHSRVYKWSYLQFYAVPGLNLAFKAGKKIFFFIEINPRFYLGRNYIGIEPGTIQFNYAPVKWNANLGVLLKLFK